MLTPQDYRYELLTVFQKVQLSPTSTNISSRVAMLSCMVMLLLAHCGKRKSSIGRGSLHLLKVACRTAESARFSRLEWG